MVFLADAHPVIPTDARGACSRLLILVLPPAAHSAQELQADLLRQERIRRNVAILEARDRDEVQPRLAAALPTSAPPLDQSFAPQVEVRPTNVAATPPATPTSNPLPVMPSSASSAEPESWTPRAATRGS